MTFSYCPGSSSDLRVLARPDLVLMTRADGDHLDALWTAVNSGSDGAALLDSLTVGGISRTPDFVLVSGLGESTTVVMARGALGATISARGDEQRIDGAGVSSWVESSLEGVTGCRLGEVAGHAHPLPLVRGAVLASMVAWGDLARSGSIVDGSSSVIERSAVPVSAQPEQVSEAPSVGAPARDAAVENAVDLAAAEPAPDVSPVAQPLGPSAADPVDATLGSAAVTIAPPPETVMTAPSSPDAAVEAASGYDHLFGATVMRSVEGAAVRPDEGEGSDDPATDRTVVVADIAALRAQRRAERARANAQPPAPRFALHLADGRVEPLDQSIIVGRSPSASRVSGSAVPRLVTLTTPNNDISRSHAQIAVEGDTVVVTDLHSMNGTLVTLPGRNPQRLREGEPTTVVVGTIIDLGDGATLTVKDA